MNDEKIEILKTEINMLKKDRDRLKLICESIFKIIKINRGLFAKVILSLEMDNTEIEFTLPEINLEEKEINELFNDIEDISRTIGKK